MRVTAKVQILAKIQKPWTDSNGVERLSFSANIMQQNGEVIDKIRLTQDMSALIEAGKSYTIVADYGNGKNGAFLRVIDIIADKV